MIDVVEIEPLNKFGVLTSCELEREYIDENLESEFNKFVAKKLQISTKEFAFDASLKCGYLIDVAYLSVNNHGVVFGGDVVKEFEKFLNEQFRIKYRFK